MKYKCLAIIFCSLLMTVAGIFPEARADVINFDTPPLYDYPSAPNNFSAATPKPQHLDIATSLGNVQFDGGVVLRNVQAIALLDNTGIYGSSSGFTDTTGNQLMSDPITITLPANLASFSIDVFNGIQHLDSTRVGFMVHDNNGNSTTFTLNDPPGSLGDPSFQTITFSNPGTTILVECFWPDFGTTTHATWDFYVDNINVQAVPVPGSLLLLGSGLLGLAGWRRFRKG